MASASRAGRHTSAGRSSVTGNPGREKDAALRKKKAGRRAQKARKSQQRYLRIQQLQQNSPFFRGLMEERQKKLDAPLLLITFMLLGIGLIALLSSSYPKAYYGSNLSPFYYFIRQLAMAIVGLILMWGVSCYDYHHYKRWAKWLYLISLVMLILVLTPLGTSINQAQRWLFGFQPSEIAKLAVILLFSLLAATRPKSVHSFKGLLIYAGLIGIFIALLSNAKPA